MRKKIIVTGSAGFIGSNFCHWLVDNTDYIIIGVDNLSGGFFKNMPTPSDRFWFRQVDVATDTARLYEIFEREQPELCYHFAAYASEGRSNYISSFIHRNNTVGTSNIINACVNNKCRLVFTSSIAVYSGFPPFREDMLPNPVDCYGVSKSTSEMNICIAGRECGLDYCIVRPYNVYGERQNLFDPSRNVVGIFMYQLINGEPMTIYGDGEQKRAFTYIGDIMQPLYNAGLGKELNGQVINIGSPAQLSVTVRWLAEALRAIVGHGEIKYIDPRHEIKFAFCDNEKAKSLLEYKHETGLYSGLEKMWTWAKEQPMRERMIPPPLEIKITNHSSIV